MTVLVLTPASAASSLVVTLISPMRDPIAQLAQVLVNIKREGAVVRAPLALLSPVQHSQQPPATCGAFAK